MTYPLIGNYGILPEFNQSDGVHGFGLVVHQLCENPSLRIGGMPLAKWMEDMDVPGIWGVDTRKLTRQIREKGTVKCVISTEELSTEEMKALCEKTDLREDYMKQASWIETREGEMMGKETAEWNVALLDFGVKKSILRELEARGCRLTVFPYGFTAQQVMDMNPDGIFLSNGPGDPEQASEAVEEVKKLMESTGKGGNYIPMFGICMGHQIMALAAGGHTFKLKYGHRGGNHGVYSKEEDKSFITSQNHGYAVEEGELSLHQMEVTEVNLNDGTVEGMRHWNRPFFSVQYHPEAGPGPEDRKNVFDKFIELMRKEKEERRDK